MAKKPQSEVWRFQIGWHGDIVTGMTRNRERWAYWTHDESWQRRFGGQPTIYLRVIVGPGWEAPSVAVVGKATALEW